MKPTRLITDGPSAKILAIALMSLMPFAYGADTDIATVPLATSSASVVKPNLMFILDDSGSMGRDYMPDWANDALCKNESTTLRDCDWGEPAFNNSAFNAVYYNPASTYTPPVLADGTSMTSFNTNALWQAVPNDGYGVQSTSSTDITADFPDVVWCIDSSPPTADRTAGTVGGECQYAVNGSGVWEFPRDNNSDSRQNVSGTTRPYYYVNSIVPIQWCDARNASEPDRGMGKGVNPAAAGVDSCSLKKDEINPFNAAKTFRYPKFGTWTRVDITPATANYPKVASRSDCSGLDGPTGCTYAEEMTNVANWWAYYRTRMQSMKTAAGLAFEQVDDKFRVGFITINPGSPVSSSKYLANSDFNAAQKLAWYTKFYAQDPGPGTPLREALSRVGRYYANVTGGINNGMSSDPIQYSCQQNFTILSSDGFWNGNAGDKLDGSSIGNHDTSVTTAPRPMLDGNSDSGTLADVAQYYYITDLRGAGSIGALGTDVGTDNNVPAQPSTDPQNDSNVQQHMTTFTVGLGVDGTLEYKSDYKETPTGDFLAIKNGTSDWPTPVQSTPTAIDDLWHAAVNGRGKYFNAKDPATLTAGLTEALVGVSATIGAAAAAATSNLEPVAGDNFVYIANYETVIWTGDVEARTLDLSTGAVNPTPVWSAQGQLDIRAASTTPGGNARKIVFFKPGAVNQLEDFFGNAPQMDATELSWFQSPWISTAPTLTPAEKPAALSQWSSLTATQQGTAGNAKNLVRFLRGDRALEADASNPASNQLYRDRTHVLGDIVNAQPVYVKTVNASYVDVGYAAYKTCINTGTGVGCTGARSPTVYVASNDGMLHAFHGDTGDERWAFIPRILMPKLYRLADVDWITTHEYLVDGSPTVADVYDPVAAKWKTILVGGLNAGGRGYYALDVTDPINPIGLWEFTVRDPASCPHIVVLNADTDDCDLGLSYGNPVISKLGNGEWVVMVTSGYNNNVSPGDGKGYLYVLNPITGVIKKKIQAANATQAGAGLADPGDTTTPLGLAKIINWVDNTNVNNTTLRVYGGDLQGNLWRFDVDSGTAYALAQLTDAGGTPQPITTKPELGETGGKAMVLVATGKYLGTTDLSTTQTQTIYGIKDLTAGTPPNPPVDARGGTVVAQVLTDTVDGLGNQIRNVTGNAVDLTTKDGWRVDLPLTGERVNVDPKLQLGTLIVASNIPANNACSAGGDSYLNFLDFASGSYIASSGSTLAGFKIANSLAVGISIVRLPNGKTVAIVTTSENKHPTLAPPFQAQSPQGRRNSYREVSQ